MGDENLGTLSYEMRARAAKFFQDMDAMDQRVAASHARWNQMGIGGGGGGGFAGSGGSGHSPAVEAAMAATGAGGSVPRAGGAGPNFAGTSNGDVTWNLKQASRETQGRYGSRGIRGGAGMEDGTPDQRIGDITSDFIQQGRMRMALGDARERSRRAGVLEQQQDKYDELKGQYDNSFRGKLNSGTNIQRLIRGTVIGLVADAVAGMASTAASYDQSMTLSGVDSVAKSRATNALQKHVLSSIPVVGGILGNVYDAAGGIGIETQNVLTERQLAFQDNRFSALMGRRQSIQQRAGIAAGPNSLTARLAGLGAARTGITASFQSESAAARAQFNAANPDPTAPGYFAGIGAFLGNHGSIMDAVNDLGNQYSEYHDDVVGRRNRLATFNSQQNSILAGRLGVNSQERMEAMRTGRYNLLSSVADVNRMRRENEFRPTAGAAGYASETVGNLSDYYSRPGTTSIDREQAMEDMEKQRQGVIGQRRDIIENLRWGGAQQYTPQIDSPLSFADRSVESQADKLDSTNKALADILAFMTAFATKP